MKLQTFLVAAIFSSSALFSADDVKVIMGFEPEDAQTAVHDWCRGNYLNGFKNGRFVEEHVTQGKYALKVVPKITEAQNWKLIENYSKGKYNLELTGQTPIGGWHDVQDWFYQRYGNLFDDALNNRMCKSRDWSGYEVLRFDVFSTAAPFIMGTKLLDYGQGPRTSAAPQGLRSNLIKFKIPAGSQMTCEIPLAEVARICELDLSKMQGFVMRYNGYEGDTDLFVDNVRLVKKDAMASDAKFPIITPIDPISPFTRKVVYFEPPKIDEAKMNRTEGKVAKIEPMTIYEGKGVYANSNGHFGGSGVTYKQNSVRGVVAYDDNRILVIFKGEAPKGARQTSTFISESGGDIGMATFDGGKTWGGVMEGEAVATYFFDWYWRGSMSSDATTGDLYFSGTQNCSSYHEHYDVFFRRLRFIGNGWVEDRFSIIDQNMNKCPMWSRSLKLKNGRIWSSWTDGYGGVIPRFSDDDGYTWEPCKDAAETKIPRPFYTPNLEDLKKPEAQRPKPPKEILIWPGTPILFAEGGNGKLGGFLVAYKDGVAALSNDGFWQVNDGKEWGKLNPQPKWKNNEKDHLGYISETILGDSKIFVARSAFFQDADGEKWDELQVASMNDDGSWGEVEILEDKDVYDSILTASGKTVFCFYTKKAGEGRYEVRYRRWKDGKWEPSVLVSTETVKINHIAVPQISRPNFVAVFWDQLRPKGGGPTWIKFAKIPNE